MWCLVYSSWRGLTELLILIGGQCEVPESEIGEDTDSHVFFIWI